MLKGLCNYIIYVNAYKHISLDTEANEGGKGLQYARVTKDWTLKQWKGSHGCSSVMGGLGLEGRWMNRYTHHTPTLGSLRDDFTCLPSSIQDDEN